MLSAFEELNLFAYHTACGAFYAFVIWCLGPIVDESREYGLFRCYLAVLTRKLCLRLLVKSDASVR